MPYTRKLLCLAASRKHNGYCIAGKDTESGEWIRPISARPGHEISYFERTYDGGGLASVLDVMEVGLIHPQPSEFQTENHLNNQAIKWHKLGVGAYADAVAMLDQEQPLWVDGTSSYNGLHDQVAEDQASELKDSLRLIRVPTLRFLIHSEGGVFGPAKRAVRVKFDFAGRTYWLKLTDPAVEHELKQSADGEYSFENAIMCISLGEAFNGNAYKLVASVILP